MKQFSTTALLLLALPLAVMSQNVTDKEITYEYRRLPLTPLDKSLKNYFSTIVLTSEAEYQEKLAAHAKQVQEAEAKYKLDMEQYERMLPEAETKYQQDLAKYEADKKEFQAKYDKELEEYNKQSIGQKMASKTLLNEGKPVLRIPQMPYKHTPSMPYKPNIPEPYMRKAPDKNLLASNLKLDGFTRNEQGAVLITATLHGFDMNEKAVTTNSAVMSNGKMVNNYTTRYTLSYRYPITLKVEVPGRGVVLNEVIPATNEMKTTTNSASVGARGGQEQLEEKTLSENMKIVNDYLNELYGYSTISRSTIFYSVEPKKMTYEEFAPASDAALMGYRKLAEEPAESAEKLRTAITQWEKALAESNIKDSKARINEEITIAAMLDVAEAAIFADDYSKAETHLFKLENMDISRKQKKKVEELNLLHKEQKKRYLANK